MGTTAQKLTYLNGTKDKLKTAINNLGGSIDNNTTFRNYATELDTIYSNLPKVSGTGTSVTLSPTLKGRLGSVLNGNTIQYTTTGKNLLNNTNGNYTNNGLTFTKNADGTITINGTSTAVTYYNITPQTLPAGSYILNGAPSGSGGATYNIVSKYGSNYQQDYGSGVTFSISEETTPTEFYIQVRPSQTLNNVVFKPMIRLSSITDDTYEQYTGGTPSPSPDYPQEIQSATGTQNVVISGKNLWNNSQVENISDFLVKTDTGLKIIKTTNGRITPEYTISLDANIEYKISCILTNTTSSAYIYCQWKATDGSTIWSPNIANGTTTFTPTKDIKGVIFYVQNTEDNGTYVEVANLQIEKGSTATPYQPYITPREHTLNLGNKKLNEIDTYKDYILGTPDNWVLHKNIAEVTYNGTYAVNVSSDSGTLKGLVFDVSNKKNSAGNGLYFERAKFLSANTSATRVENTIYENAVNVVALGSTTDDLDTLKTKFNGGKLLYILAEEQTETITDTNLISQLNELYYAQSNDDTTNIDVTGNLPIKITASAIKGA